MSEEAESGKQFQSIARQLLFYVIVPSVTAVFATLMTFHALIGANFDTINARISDQKTHVTEQFNTFTDRTTDVLDKMDDKLSQLDADIEFIRKFATEVSDMENKVGYGPALIEARLERLPVGGPGQVPVPDFPTYTFELRLGLSRAEIERQREKLEELLQEAIASDRRYKFDPSEHEVIVYENVVLPLDAEASRLDLTALVVYKNK